MTTASEDRARRALGEAARKAEAIDKKFWFLDLKFTQFATPRLIGFVFMLYLVLSVLSFAGSTFYFLMTLPILFAAAAIIADLIITLISAVMVRVFLEAFLVVFRIAESLTELRHLQRIAEK